MNSILSDARLALRLLARSPGFTFTILTVLSLGIGATTAMFSIVESLLLRPLPYERPEELSMIWCTKPNIGPSTASLPDFLEWREQGRAFAQMTAVDYDAISLSSEGALPENLPGASVSGDFFPMFGIHAKLGRLFGPEDDRVGGPKVVVLSAAVWHRRFGGDPGIIGRTLTLNGEPHTVLGIAPEGFRFSGPYSDRADVWIPLAVHRKDFATLERGDHFLHVLARRKTSVSLSEAQAQLSAVAKSLEAKYPNSNTGKGVQVVELKEALVGSSRDGIWILFAAVALVFLVVCANVASLLLTRAAARRGEMATRAALGATGGQLSAQLITETLVLFLIASFFGGLLAFWLVEVIAPGIIQSGGAFTIDIRVDAIALAGAILATLICGLIAGLAPATVVLRVEPQAVLKESAAQAGISRAQRRVRGVLVVAQVALAFTLLVGSGLSLRTFWTLASTPPGFDPNNLATARVVLHEARYPSDAKVLEFYQALLSQLAAQPGVSSVAANSTLPLAGSNWNGSFQIEGRTPWAPGERPVMGRNIVTPGYFATMRIPLLKGRDFTEADVAGGRLVVIISQSAADKFFPGEDPIGRRLDWGEDRVDPHPWREIIGVAGDVRRFGLARPTTPESYAPMAQQPNRWMGLVARSGRAESFLKDLPGIVQSVDPEQAVASRRLMSARYADSIGPQRFTAVLLSAFAGVALLLATIGVFGLVSYSTAQRTREIGVRLALGADPFEVLRLVMAEGLRLLGLGLGLGALGAFFVGQRLGSTSPPERGLDVLVYLLIFVILALTGALASLLPAWRAVRIPPSVALRYE